MKPSSNLYKIAAIALVIVFAITAVAKAQTDDSQTPPPPPPQGAPADGSAPAPFGDRIRDQVQNNRDARNIELQGMHPGMMGSTTMPYGMMGGHFSSTTSGMPGMRGMMRYGYGSTSPMWHGSTTPMWHGSTTPPWGGPRGGQGMPRMGDGMMRYASTSNMFMRPPGGKVPTLKKMALNAFEMRKNTLLEALNDALSNLNNISGRIQTEITKVQGTGNPLTDAVTLFATAEDKLATAQADVAAFQVATATSSVTTGNTTVAASTTTQIDLTQPRSLGNAAIQAVKDARDAMEKVVDSIIQAVGGNAASTTNNLGTPPPPPPPQDQSDSGSSTNQ